MSLSSDPRLPQIEEQVDSRFVTVPFWRRVNERIYQLWRDLANEMDQLRGPSQGADVASATTIVLGTYSSCVHVTGTAVIDLLDNRVFAAGAEVTLIFDSTASVRHNRAASGTGRPILLAAASLFSASADDTLTLIFDRANDRFLEKCRTVI